MVISADIFAVLLRYFYSSIGNLIIMSNTGVRRSLLEFFYRQCSYCRAKKFSGNSEVRVNSADFEVRENDKIIRENNDHSLLEFRALKEFRIFS